MRTLKTLLVGLMIFLPASLLTGGSRAHAQVTRPEDYLGFKPGADFHLMTYEDAIGYFEHIASQTDRMVVLDMGETSGGRRMKYAVISSAENLERLDHFKEINRRVSLPRGLSDDEAKRLADEGRTIVWIDGGLHGTEVAPAQLLPQLAYDLVTGSDRQMEMVRENVIALLVFANPDGMTIVSDWYMGNVGTPYEVSPIPWLYHEYVGHDNNRDSFMANLVETRNMNRAHSQEWFPEILYNQHQTGPFPARIWIPPDAEPTNPNVHPLIVRWKSLIGTAMGKAFEENDQPGAISRTRYDTWYPGYATQVVDGHNVISILTETQLYRYATPQYFTVNDFPEEHRDLTKGVFYPNPWPGGWWRIGDAVAYNNTACKAVLEVAARYRYELIYDKYKAGKDVLARFENEPPYGFIIAADQPDRSSTALLLERMMVNGIEVYTADESFKHNGITYPMGTFVLPTSQPFGLFLKNIFERQAYPDLREYSHLWQGLVNPEDWEGAPLRPYDGVGWTLPIQMGVEYREMSSPLSVGLTPVESVRISTAPPGGGSFVFSHADNGSITAAVALLEGGADVQWAKEPFTLDGRSFPTGTYLVRPGRVSNQRVRELAELTGLEFKAGNPGVSATPLRMPRIGLHKAWVSSMDAGWITYILDTYGIPFESVTNAEIRAGKLHDRFDVMILPDQTASQIIEGHPVGTIPPDYVGGIGDEGIVALRDFVQSGGRLICNNRSCDLPIEHFHLPVKDILDGVPADSFNCPGAILKADSDTSHPMAYGMPDRGMVFFSEGRAFEIEEGWEADAEASEGHANVSIDLVATYPFEPLLLSGWMIGDERIRGKAAALDISLGAGKVLAFGFNVHNRAQARSTMRLFFNALLYE
ncbi:MAG: hypothetical protein MUO50_20090 [Longimicrobiales bacterium]|nr:hypothetical protein [Longimicrobiales bacterium]